MEYKIRDLVDDERLKNLLYGFHEVFEIPVAIVDEEGNEIFKTDSYGICTNFYKKSSNCNRLCTKAHSEIFHRISTSNTQETIRCCFGIGIIGVPIIIENKTLAVIVAQEFILEESDRIHQKEKRDRYGFEEESFKNAIDGLPVISKERAAIISSFLQNCSQVISEVGYERVKQIEMNKELLNEIIEQDKLKTEFFANVSHELRTPLNVILGAIQVLNLIFRGSDEKLNRGKFEKYIYIIRQNCLRLLRLVNNLIDVTKIDSGYIQLNMRSIDIVKLVEDLIISVKEYVESKGMDFDFHTDIREKTMLCDMDKIERIMLNLISNAVKFSEAGDKITVKIEASDEKVIISVKDTGMGIPKEMQDRIFDRFVQAHKTIRRSHEGSGIGLTLAKSLVQMHGGNIWLHSELGKGSEFVFELPVVQDINTHQNVAESAASFEANLEKIQIEFSDI